MAGPEYFSPPSVCPICSHPLETVGDFLFCLAKSCPAKLSGSVKVWVERLGLLNWGDALVGSLTDPEHPNHIKTVADLYRLSIADIEEHCSGPKMAKKCWKVLNDSKSLPLEVVLAGMNIPNLGLATATDIVKAGYDTVQKVLDMSVEQLIGVPNIGDVTARQIRSGLDSKQDVLLDLDTVLNIQSVRTGPLGGKKVCITGDVWAPRKAVQKMIAAAGGQAVDSVSKDTSFLVCDEDRASSKSKRAAAYGIPVISGSDLKSLLDGTSNCDDFAKK